MSGEESKRGQVTEIEPDTPAPSAIRYGVGAAISIVFSNFIQTFESQVFAARGGGSRFAVCTGNAYAAHAEPHVYNRAGLRVSAAPGKHSQCRGWRVRPSTQSHDDRIQSQSLLTCGNFRRFSGISPFRGPFQIWVRRRCPDRTPWPRPDSGRRMDEGWPAIPGESSEIRA